MIVVSSHGRVAILLLELDDDFVELVLTAFVILLPDEVRRNQKQIWFELLLAIVDAHPSLVAQ